jgi:hypothetical protein
MALAPHAKMSTLLREVSGQERNRGPETETCTSARRAVLRADDVRILDRMVSVQ